MSDIANVVKEEEGKIKNFPVILVNGIKRNKGKEMTTKRLPKDIFYRLRAQVNKTYKITYLSYFTSQEISDEVEKLNEKLGINNTKYYVAPIKRKK